MLVFANHTWHTCRWAVHKTAVKEGVPYGILDLTPEEISITVCHLHTTFTTNVVVLV